MTGGLKIIINLSFFLSFSIITKSQDTIILQVPLSDTMRSAEPNTAYFVDSTNAMDIKGVLGQHFQPTADPRLSLQGYGRKKITAWLRWQIVNPTSENIEISIIFYRTSFFSLYTTDPTGIHFIKETPIFYSSQTKNQRRASRIIIPAGKMAAVYAQMNDPLKNIVSGYPIFGSSEKWKEDARNFFHGKRHVVFADVFFLAIFFFIIIHTLPQYFFTRRQEFLLYAFYGAVVFTYFLFKFEEGNYVDIFFGYFPYVHKYGNVPLSYLMYFAYYRFVRSFINFKEIAPWFYKVILVTEKIIIGAIVASVILVIIDRMSARTMLWIVLRCYLLLAGFTGIFLLFRSRMPQAYFIATGSCFLLIGGLASMVLSWTVVSVMQFDVLIFMKLGMVIELLCFTLGLSYKTSLIEKEKILAQQQLILQLEENKKLQSEMTTRLEVKVKQQMSEIAAQQGRLEKEKEQQLTLEFKKKLAEMELQFLKSQLNPHFYFNTLNNLYGLTLIDPKKAPNAILKLSDIMEYVIYDCKSEKVPLEKELKFISSYVDLEKLRYDDNSRIQLHIHGNSEGKFISPLLLIQFIENAFKHGLEQGKNDDYLEVFITIKNGYLFYRSLNRINGRSYKTNGIGLANVQKRLVMLYPGHSLVIDDSGPEFKVDLQFELT